MSRWKDDPEWSGASDATSEGWAQQKWILRGGVWDDTGFWVDSEQWDGNGYGDQEGNQ